MPEEPPLPSESEGTEEPEAPEPAPSAPSKPSPPPFKASTFVLTFLFFMGLWMIVDSTTRIQVAGSVIGLAFWPLLGFSGQYPILTMCIAAVLEMAATAVAYNWATDWVKAAKAQKWSAAFRKVQLVALRSGKKNRVEALAPHQQTVNQLSSEVSIAQLKGMAVTWFLVIAIYTWVYLFLVGWHGHPGARVSFQISGSSLGLTTTYWIIPLWFLLFTFYTVPFSLLFRRILKHLTLRRYADRSSTPKVEAGAPGGTA